MRALRKTLAFVRLLLLCVVALSAVVSVVIICDGEVTSLRGIASLAGYVETIITCCVYAHVIALTDPRHVNAPASTCMKDASRILLALFVLETVFGAIACIVARLRFGAAIEFGMLVCPGFVDLRPLVWAAQGTGSMLPTVAFGIDVPTGVLAGVLSLFAAEGER